MVQTDSNTASIIAQIRAAFALVDTKNDGRIDGQELKHMLSKIKIPISDAIVDQLIAEISKDGDGTITEQEFFRWMLKMDAHEDDLVGEMKAAFHIFDTDGNGTIEIEDIKFALELMGESITEEEVKEILEMGDLDKNGSISFEEFMKLLH